MNDSHGFLSPLGLGAITRISDAETRSITAENPTGERGGGAKANVGDDTNTTQAASELGRGWKVRPCIHLDAGQSADIVDVEGPGAIQHIWMTVEPEKTRYFTLRIFYDDQQDHPAVECPLGDFFANGADGCAIVNSMPIAVGSRGGMNSYWPMPFRKRIRINVTNDWKDRIEGVFYQVTYARTEVPADAAYLHAQFRRSMTTREHPEHTLLDSVQGRGHYVGTYIVWDQFSNGWWGEGEIKFYMDGDREFPTICGTGTEDYFGGAWGFRAATDPLGNPPVTFSAPFVGYPQALIGGERVPRHALYRWHIPDPIRFRENLRVTIQALGWWPTGKYQPLTDDLASTAFWYQQLPTAPFPAYPSLNERLPR
ncbi:MAG: glycoside hydrolase family 172 protein [Planctomycetota bacterium]